MKQLFFMLALVFASSAMFAQTIDNARVKVVFNGDRAEITLKDATANAGIGELVDAVRVKDFVKQNDGLYADIYVGNADGLSAVWYMVKDGEEYGIGFLDDAANDGSKFTNLADAKKAMKLAMRGYYAAHGTLDPVNMTSR